jgi:hypothetical protein
MSEKTMRTVTIAIVAGAGIVAALNAGCGSDLLTVDVDLQRQTYNADFGSAQGTVPVVACNPAGPDVCGAAIGPTQVDSTGATATVQLACDAATDRCFAQARVLGANAVNVLQDDDFVTKVERHSVFAVHDVDVRLVVPVNTLTFAVPQLTLYVGPAGSTKETDSGVVKVGTTDPLAAGATVPDSSPRHLVVSDDSPAHDFISNAVENKQTMVFLVVMNPRIEAGAALPAGTLQVDLLPRLKVGL